MLNFNVQKNGRLGTVFGLGLILLALSGCGGGSASGPADATTSAETKAAQAWPTPVQTQALLKRGAALNTAELARAAAGKPAVKSSAKAATKAAANGNLVTVYRFFNSQTKAHFYTASEAEKTTILANLPQFSLDGAAFFASSVSQAGLSPVYRFYNSQSGVHFYTISEDERTLLLSSMPQFRLDGVAYYASKVAASGFAPLYRFYLSDKGFHFYSSSEMERANIVATLPQYRLEGVGYHVIVTTLNQANLKLSHTGITAQQCYETGTSTLVACGSGGALALNAQQDGHRTAVNAMAYSEVPKGSGGTFARTECVKDNTTGLIWEGKTANGPRAFSKAFTNYDDPAQTISDLTGIPDQTLIDSVNNSTTYVRYVNDIALCGFTNWRRPTPDELVALLNFGVVFPAPMIDEAWFPNTPVTRPIWSATTYALTSDYSWAVGFAYGRVYPYMRSQNHGLRLVRDAL